MNYKILFTSKNNYDLLENWIKEYSNYNIPEIINLDLGSSPFHYKKGKEICCTNQIEFIEANRTEFQDNIKQIFTHLKKSNCYYLLYLHQDCFPIEKETFKKIDNYIVNNDLSKYGCIGFNNYHDLEIKHLNKASLELMSTSRCVLQKGNGYYMKYPRGSRANYSMFNKGSVFCVENVFWSSLLLSSSSFERYINVDLRFNFFLSPDDMAYQFLSKGIYNIVIPDIHFIHDQSVKTKYGIPKDSPIGKKKDVEAMYGKLEGIHEIWSKKWNFDYDPQKAIPFFNNRYIKHLALKICPKFYSNFETKARKSYKISKNKNKLFTDFYNHDPIKGPLKYFNLKFK